MYLNALKGKIFSKYDLNFSNIIKYILSVLYLYSNILVSIEYL